MHEIEVLLFGGPMDGQTMKIPKHTEYINMPFSMRIPRDEIGRFIPDSKPRIGQYVYDSERTVHNIVSEPSGGPTESCYRWVEDGY
jgi:hypothetical protein